MPLIRIAAVAIVEDHADLREELCFQLHHMGCQAETFENAQQLYRRMAFHTFDVVILDIGLEGENGLEICSYLRGHDRYIGIVFVTARALRDDKLVGLKAGADAYLTKPVDIDELSLVIQRLAERRAFSADSTASSEKVLPIKAGPTLQWVLQPDESVLYVSEGLSVRLTLNEVRILRTLFAKPGLGVSDQELAIALGLLPDEYNKHRVEVIISRLRSKVTRETGSTLPVKARRGQGYVFQP